MERAPRGLTRILATGVVVLGMAVTATGAGPAGAAPRGGSTPQALNPPPPGSVELMPGDFDVYARLITDDAVWLTAGQVVYRRSLATTPTSVTLGRAEAVARTGSDGFAVHDGTLAYVRPVDGRVVLRAPDGTEEVPVWGALDAFRFGVWSFTDDWVAAASLPGTLYSRTTGEQLDLASLSAPPAGSTVASTGPVVFTDDRVLWGAGGGLLGGGWSRCYTAALGPDGVVGAVTVLDTATRQTAIDQERVLPATISGSLVAWHHEYDDPAPGPERTLYWYLAPPYTGAPSQLDAFGTLTSYLGSFTGTQRIVTTWTPSGHRLDWQDLAAPDPSTVVRSVVVPWPSRAAIEGPLVAYSDSISSSGDPFETWFLDADRRPVVADQRAPLTLPEFRDVLPYQDFAKEILWLADLGVVTGFADGTFRGLAPINRDAVAAFLYRAVHGPGPAPACTAAPFVDVPASHPFCGEIAWLTSAGVIRGWPDGTFRPAAPVTREAMAAFMYRLAHEGSDAPACAAAPFTDVLVSNPFCGAVEWLAQTGVTTGWPDGTFRPALSIERQAMAAFVARFLLAGLVPAGESVLAVEGGDR